jgi:hypothetical protein
MRRPAKDAEDEERAWRSGGFRRHSRNDFLAAALAIRPLILRNAVHGLFPALAASRQICQESSDGSRTGFCLIWKMKDGVHPAAVLP